MSFRSLLNQTVDIKRLVQTTDGQGGYTNTWTTIHRRIPCRFQALTSKEAMLAYDKATVFANYVIHMEYLSDVIEGNRLYLGTRAFEVKMKIIYAEANEMMKLAVVEIGRGEA
jgi:SPP1 family predicted phage head-tail adaptor